MMIKVSPGTAHGDEGGPGLDQAAGQQRLLAQAVATVGIAHLRGFLVQIEGPLRAARHQHFIRLLRVHVGRRNLLVRAHAALPAVHLLGQRAAVAQALNRQPFRQFQAAGQVLAAHRIVSIAHVARAPHVRHQRVRQRHVPGNARGIGPAQLRGDRAHGRIAAAIAPVVRAPRQRVAGLHGDRRVIARAAIDRADDRQLVHQARRQRQMLAHMHARHFGRNMAERTANLRRCGGLGVPHVDVAGTARKPEQHHVRLRFRLPGRHGQRLLLQKRGQ